MRKKTCKKKIDIKLGISCQKTNKKTHKNIKQMKKKNNEIKQKQKE